MTSTTERDEQDAVLFKQGWNAALKEVVLLITTIAPPERSDSIPAVVEVGPNFYTTDQPDTGIWPTRETAPSGSKSWEVNMELLKNANSAMVVMPLNDYEARLKEQFHAGQEAVDVGEERSDGFPTITAKEVDELVRKLTGNAPVSKFVLGRQLANALGYDVTQGGAL